MKKIFPHCYLLLYCKGWIRFKNSKGFIDDLRKVIELDNYIHDKNPVGQIMNAFNNIKKYCENLGIHLTPEWDNFGYFYEQSKWRTWHIKDEECEGIDKIEVAFLYEIYGLIQMLKINDNVAIKYVDYKKWKVKIACSDISTTYANCQKQFDEMFKDHFIDESYEEPWNIKHGYKI